MAIEVLDRLEQNPTRLGVATMNYFYDPFTGTTWDEFLKAGANISGFPPEMKSLAARAAPGDVFLCYLTGVMRWVGALEVLGPSRDTSRIWKDQEYPVRFDVRPLVVLTPENGVPMSQLEGKVSFFAGPKDRGKFQGLVRKSGRNISQEDARTIMNMLGQAHQEPVSRPVDPKKLARKPFFRVEAREGKGRQDQDDDTGLSPGAGTIDWGDSPSNARTRYSDHATYGNSV